MAPPARAVPHVVLAMEKLGDGWSVSLILKSTLVNPAPPIFFTEILKGELAMPTGCKAKVRVEGVTEKAGAAIPVPLSETVLPLLMSSRTVRAPVWVPAWVGRNQTVSTQRE